jgi:hypothetical protein
LERFSWWRLRKVATRLLLDHPKADAAGMMMHAKLIVLCEQFSRRWLQAWPVASRGCGDVRKRGALDSNRGCCWSKAAGARLLGLPTTALAIRSLARLLRLLLCAATGLPLPKLYQDRSLVVRS